MRQGALPSVLILSLQTTCPYYYYVSFKQINRLNFCFPEVNSMNLWNLKLAQFLGGFLVKSRKIVLTVLLLVLGLSTVAHASAVKVAFVDFDFLVGAHPEYELKVTEFQDTRAKMIESFQKEIADIESESEIDAIAQKYDLELQELYEEMQTYLVESILVLSKK